ncbi:phage holin family protein [Cupriavidus basilensis]|uniref:Phage holin family protein n=1 Tax=Cupriavidus basilensis TaxID=68895 RepID=A0ABT6ALZ2_9BURK|nr:phage holin family protein [Cupriavidus basilensis]MDF3833613.1 phage holin family protein [Cupriavidus basilensis]
MSDPTPSPKFMDALRSLAGSLVAMVQTRLELASVELAEERSRLMKMALLACFGLVFFGLAMVTLTVLITIVFWDTYRWQAMGALVAIYLAACAVCLAFARHLMRNAPPLFEATLAEIDKDREILRR